MRKIEKFKIVLMLKFSIDEMNDEMKNKNRIWSILKENFFLKISFNNIMEINNKAPKICVNDIEFRLLDDITSGPKNLKQLDDKKIRNAEILMLKEVYFISSYNAVYKCKHETQEQGY